MASKFMPKTLPEEKQEIKKALRTPFNEGAIWQPLAIGWFEKWKTYVNFDDEVPEPRAKELVDSLHPGEIDNNSLQGSFGDEMRRDAVEGRDYVLMPSSFVNMLFEKYGGGPSYPRKVLNVGSVYNPIYQVNLFPIRIEVYFCDRNHPNPEQEEGRFLRRYFTKNMSLESIADDLLRAHITNSYSLSSRHWLRDTPPDVTGRTRTDGSRLLTCDVVDFDGDWRFVRSDKHRNIQEVLGDRDCIELIVETVSYRNPRETDWPRFAQLESWKKDLRVGDMVDAKDRKGKFYSSKILHIDEAGNLLVHFIGWASSYDEKITDAEISSRIHPLHSNSFDRSTWEEGSKLDVCIADLETNGVWVTGTIISVDPMNDKVEVMVEAKERAEGLKKVTAKSAGTANSNGFDDDEIDDDDSLKKKTTTGNVSTTSLTAAMEEVKTSDSSTAAESEENLRVWYDIYSDSIAPQYTHTQAARSTYGTGGYGSLYGSNYAMTVYNQSSAYSSYDRHTKGTPPVAGAVGLQNLGNTCFMNSILQCLSNTQVLTEIFTSNVYKEQINYDNPLGHSGKIALTYGKLMKDMWSGAYIRVVPREFKTVIGEYRPQFAGYEQQDSQEMMSCLLDGLHEDLNRIHKKPYTQKIESKGRPDELIAAESWRRFLLRNDSLILEHFFGMQKSHVTCQKCGKESVTFDPYSALSLPIPIRNTRTIVTVVRLLPASSPPLRVALEVELTATMSQLKKILIDRLIELKLLTIPVLPDTVQSSAVPSSPAPPAAPAEDSGYEMVDKADVAGVGKDYQMIVDDGELQTTELSSPPAQPVKGPAAKKPTIYDAFHFHFGMLYGTRPTTVFKNYNTQEARNTAIQAFVHKMDLLIAFQLEHALPEFKAIASSYSSSYFSPYGTKPQKEAVEEEESRVFGMDLCIALRMEPTTTYSYSYTTSTNQARLELLGYPHRLSFERGVSNADVHRTVREVLRRTIPAESPLLDAERDPTTWPYELVVTSTYGAVINRTVKDSEDTFVELKEGMEILVVYWLNTAISQGIVEINRAKELVDAEPTTPVDDLNSADTLTEEEDLDDDEFCPATVYQQQAKQKKSSVAQQGSNKRSKKSGISIYDCLDKYVEREQLADTETVYCNKCKEMLAPVKKMDLWTTPDVLILHLKRFQFLTGQYTVVREKITELVDFPVEGLDLTHYLQGPKSADAPPIYDLFAVSHHMGGLGGGHYTATARNFLDNRWYNFNDSTVTPTDASSAITATAYVLFYKRRTGSLKWAGAVPHPVGMPDEADD